MDFRLLGAFVFVLVVLSGGAALPLLGFSALLYLVVFLLHVGSEAWQSLGRQDSPDDADAHR